jgi:Uma2 family endonuclease
MQQRLTREEYLRWVEDQPKCYERIAGEPVAMSRQPAQHVRIKSRVWAALDQAIRQAGLDCEALGDGVTIEVDADSDYEPDAVVNCGPPLPPDTTVATNPVIVVEVLSPATQSIDTSDKLVDYFRVPSIRHYLILRARRPEIIHHSRVGNEVISRMVDRRALIRERAWALSWPPGSTATWDGSRRTPTAARSRVRCGARLAA